MDKVETELLPVPHPSLPRTLKGCVRAAPERRAQMPRKQTHDSVEANFG